jgi:hypothetical protein
MNLTERFRNAKEAVLASDDPLPDSRNRKEGYRLFSDSYPIDTLEPDERDLETYWEQYKQNPLVRRGVDIYAEDVTAPGYRVQADDEELADQLEDWLSSSAIIAGEDNNDFSELIRDFLIQQIVRGTALVEVVPYEESPESVWGFRLINVSTLSAYTYENRAVLIRPEDTEIQGVATTSRDEAACYGQWDNNSLAGPFNETDTVYLSQNDVLKQTNDADTNDIFGVSSVEPVSKEIKELDQMLTDLGQAIHSKGFPHWVFKMGEPNGDVSSPRAGIWPDEEMQKYRDSHKDGNWSVGQKDFVPGDVDIETISSDVPEIEQILDWYIEQIVTALPTPKFKLGHADSVNRDITKTQQTQYERKLKSERRRLEDTFTPVLKRKARELGASDSLVDSISLRIAEPHEENPLERDDFDAEEFASFAQGLKRISGGSPQDVVPASEAREMLGLPEVDDGESDEELDETDEQVVQQFEELYGEPAIGDGIKIEPSAD